MTSLFTNANCLSWDPIKSDFDLHCGHLLLENNCITLLSSQSPLPAADITRDLGYRLVTPPLVNGHHHFYSLPARGLQPTGSMNDFPEILVNLWWKLDRSLSHEAIRLAARQSIRESIRHGVLTIFDHHASPAVTTDALTTIAQEMERFRVRGVLCHEISDRNGEAIRNQQLEENRNFISAHADHTTLRGVMGLHASFTIADNTLATIAGTPVHIHLAEDPVDDMRSLELYGNSACQRLDSNGLLRSGTIVAHGNHLRSDELELLATSGTILVHNPHSNMNNAVGTLDLSCALEQGCIVAPGTDGMHSNITATLKDAFLLTRHGSGSPTRGFPETRSLFTGMFKQGGLYFKDLPLLRTGDTADLVIWDYLPLTPLTQDNIWGHIIYGLLDSTPTDVIHDGEYLYEQGRLLVEHDDPLESQELFRSIWEEYKRA